MPFIVDFRNVAKPLQMTVKPFGWVYNEKGGVDIEYGISKIRPIDPEPSMCMRVKGTGHTWCWYQQGFYKMAANDSGQIDYAQIFTDQLEEFRINFLLWIRDSNTQRLDWVREYYEMFKGRFYDFSAEEQKEFEESQREMERDQQEISEFAKNWDRIGEEGWMSD